jgi:hypothetical protein
MTSHREMLEETFMELYENFDMFFIGYFLIKVCVSIKRLKLFYIKRTIF